ncbi:MAG: hypothetical protein JRG91_19710 [Deltaproteobacteria bacterium]|nr:hypothetical protein [Deltaproteobacteria bacterium]
MRFTLLLFLAALLWAGATHAASATCPEGTLAAADTGSECTPAKVAQCTTDNQCGRWKACFTGQCVSKHTATGGRGLLIGGYVLLGLSLVTAAAAIILIGPTIVLSFILGIPVALAEFCVAVPLIIAGHVHQIRRKRMLKASAQSYLSPFDEPIYSLPGVGWSF